MRFSSALLATFLLLTACENHKYPYPVQFVAPTALSETVLPQPPAMDSPEVEKEIKTIVTAQNAMSVEEKAIIKQENKISPEMIVQPVLGKKYTRASNPALYSLLAHAGSDTWRIADANQEYWKSPRPWMADTRVQLIAPKITSYGYPSGHTSTNTVWAYVLSELFPAKRDALFDRANEIATHRMHGGVHFPHDLAGGRALAKAVFEKMKEDPQFQRELAAAKHELRHGKAPQARMDAPAASACAGAHC